MLMTTTPLWGVPQAVVIQKGDAARTTADALQRAGLQVKIVERSADLNLGDLGISQLVVLSADVTLEEQQATSVADFVRRGGGLFILHTSNDPDYWWNTYRGTKTAIPQLSPLWDILPFVAVPTCDQFIEGLRNPFGPTKVGRQANHPLLRGVDLTTAPTWPLHGFMVLPTHPLVQGTHFFYAWSEDQLKSSLWNNGQVLAWGDDPEQRPLLLTAEYGSGRTLAAAMPLFTSAFNQWIGSQALVRNLVDWLTSGSHVAVGVMQKKIYGVGVPWIAGDSLARMGYHIVDTAEDAEGALVYALSSKAQEAALTRLAHEGKQIIVANARALELPALAEMVPMIRPVTAMPEEGSASARRPVPEKLAVGRGVQTGGSWTWRKDERGEGQRQHWFTDDTGSWLDQFPKTSEADAVKDDGAVRVSSIWKFRCEGTMIDRRDLIEGWHRPDYDDSQWEQRKTGDAPWMPVTAGALWFRYTLDVQHGAASRNWLVPPEPYSITAMLDGQPLTKPVAVTSLKEGSHCIALRCWPAQRLSTTWALNAPWGSGPNRITPLEIRPIDLESNEAPTKSVSWWTRTDVTISDSACNALKVGTYRPVPPGSWQVYVNGEAVCDESGIFSAPWHQGKNTVVIAGVSDPGNRPDVRLVRAPTAPQPLTTRTAERLAGMWYVREDDRHVALTENWAGALSSETAAAPWRSVVADADAGVIMRMPDEKPRWLATPFLVSPQEASGPARLVIDTTGAALGKNHKGPVPADLIKTAWINGRPVRSTSEFFSAMIHEPKRDKTTLVNFVLTGLLRPGINWIAFPVDMQNVHGLRMAAPSGLSWQVPLPKLDFSGTVDRLTWQGELARLNAPDMVARGRLLVPPSGATILARFSDGIPAVARYKNITFATGDLSLDWTRFIDTAVRHDWASTRRDKDGPGVPEKFSVRTQPDTFNLGTTLRTYTEAQQVDGAQVPATLLRGESRLLAVQFSQATGGLDVQLQAAPHPRWLGYRVRNWMGMLLDEGRVAVPTGATRVQIAASPADPSPMTTRLKDEWFVRLALLEEHGAQVTDYLERAIDVRPAVEVLLAPSDQMHRDLPDSVPGSKFYEPKFLKFSLLKESMASPVVVPGEKIHLRAMFRNTTAVSQPVKATLKWQGSAPESTVVVRELSFILQPWEQRTMSFPCGFVAGNSKFLALVDEDTALLRTPAASATGPALVCGQVVVESAGRSLATLPLTAIRPWKSTAAVHPRLPNSHSAMAGFEMFQLGMNPTLDTIEELRHNWWAAPGGGDYYSLIDMWRDNLLNTAGGGGGYSGFRGKSNFAWGGFDQIWEGVAKEKGSGFTLVERSDVKTTIPPGPSSRLALDNGSFLPNGALFMEWQLASITREYNRAAHGNQRVSVTSADYWGNGFIHQRERNVIQFLRWLRDQGRPLGVATIADLRQRFETDLQLKEDWARFRRDGFLAWSDATGAGFPPDSVSLSQGDVLTVLLQERHSDTTLIRHVLKTHNEGEVQSANLRRRGDMLFAYFRLFNPTYPNFDSSWYYSKGLPQTAGGAWGECGSVFGSPEIAQLQEADRVYMGIRHDDGSMSSLFNAPIGRGGAVPLFARRREGPKVIPAEMIARDIEFHFHGLIGPQKAFGAHVVTPLERVGRDLLDGKAVDLGLGFMYDVRPTQDLCSMLRNYGVAWSAYVSQDGLGQLGNGDNLLYMMPSAAGSAEAATLVSAIRRGAGAAIFFTTGGTKRQETPLSDLLGVRYQAPGSELGSVVAPDGPPRPYPSEYGPLQFVSTGAVKAVDWLRGIGTLRDRVLLRGIEAGKGRALFCPMNAGTKWGLDHDMARQLTRAVNWATNNPISLPEGVNGYGFQAEGMTFLVLEDIKYTGGPASVRVRLPAGRYCAADLYTGAAVPVTPEAGEFVLWPTLPPNGALLVVIQLVN